MPAGRLRIFSFVTEPNAAMYRAVLSTFVAAKERFRLHLRPMDVLSALLALPSGALEPPPEISAVDAALRQLSGEWGLLEAHPDTAAVATVEEFFRPRFLYRLTQQGAAAEQAVRLYEELCEQRGELQTAALSDIRSLLSELLSLLSQDEWDAGRAYLTLDTLCSRFGQLTEQAQAFLGSLQRAIDLQGASLEAFVAYKQRLIDYLERFVQELLLSRLEIAQQLVQAEQNGIFQLLELVAQRQLVDALSPTDADRAAAHTRWRERWAGLRAWFVGEAGQRSQAEELRRHALSAIPALLSALSGLHDRRARKSDRSADLRTLARWFAEAKDDADAHCLFRAAFGLSPARHLRIDEESLAERDQAPVPASMSFLAAPPLRIAPRLRSHGRIARPGRAASVIDRTEDKERLQLQAEAEAEEHLAAQRRIATGKRIRLSALGLLGELELRVLLELLSEGLAAGADGQAAREVESSDGLLQIKIERVDDSSVAELQTSIGTLRGPDFFITIRETAGAGMEDRIKVPAEVQR
jgi:uncharacterized protein (TIGR02677 family)